MKMARTTQQWWDEIKADDTKLEHWLQRQYVGEVAAVNLLSTILLRHGSEAPPQEWDNVYRVMMQEALHAKWVKEIMDNRGIPLEKNADSERRYWNEVLPHVTNFQESMAAAYHAEDMRLARIGLVAEEKDPKYADIADVFKRILPHEQWHKEVFDEMRKGKDLTRYHEKGLEALNLLLQ